MINLEIFCICIHNKLLNKIKEIDYTPVGLGSDTFSEEWTRDNSGINISSKNKFYGELTFHYWFWKNKLQNYSKNEWFAICHYRRFFLKDKIDMSMNIEIELNTLKSKLIYQPLDNWKDCDVVLCEPTNLGNQKKMKLIKRGFKSLIKNPLIFFDKKKHNIKLHFDMFHGYGNLDKAINMLSTDDKKDFEDYVNINTSFSANIMYLSNNVKIIDQFYSSLFGWLEKCEQIFGLKETNVYGLRRMYTFLAERYTSFWFEKYSKVKYAPWLFRDFT